MEECEKWLADYLRGQVFKSVGAVKAEAEKRGFTRGQLSKARKALGVALVSDITIYAEPRNWFWLIPREDNGDA
ncbi:MAG TPA: hypothetical protein PKB13_04295 [Clostridia bacterium]|nr:hypothetical protein [Clostridia bacterium]